MTNYAIEVLKVIFNAALSFLTAFNIPGTNVTPLGMLFFASLSLLAVRMIKLLFGSEQ